MPTYCNFDSWRKDSKSAQVHVSPSRVLCDSVYPSQNLTMNVLNALRSLGFSFMLFYVVLYKLGFLTKKNKFPVEGRVRRAVSMWEIT